MKHRFYLYPLFKYTLIFLIGLLVVRRLLDVDIAVGRRTRNVGRRRARSPPPVDRRRDVRRRRRWTRIRRRNAEIDGRLRAAPARELRSTH